MKKYALLIVLISLVGYGLMCSGKRKMPELFLANVEALASGETSVDCPSDGRGCLSGGYYYPSLREASW